MTKKLEKLKELNTTLVKRCAELETYMFVENIVDVPLVKTKEDNREVVAEIK